MLKGYWGYVAISVAFGIVAACSPFSILFLCVFIIWAIYLVLMLPKAPCFICLLSFFAMLFYAGEIEKRNKPRISPGLSSFIGVIVTPPSIDGDRLSFVAETGQKERLRVSYTIPNRLEKKRLGQLEIGTVCSFRGNMKPAPAPRNTGSFDYKQYLHRQHIHFLFFASSFSSCYKKQPSFFDWLLSLRQSSIQYVQKNFPSETVGFMNALIYGDRQDLSGEVEEQYQQLGVIHLLAISGSHISLLVAICYYVLLRLGFTRQTATAFLLIIVPLYMFLAGASPSVVRASIMALCILWYFFVSVPISGFDALSITAILMLIWNPYSLYDIGFEFSFVSTAALVLSARTIIAQDKGWLRSAVNVAVLSQLASLPITVHYFGQFSPYSLILNLIYVPYLSFLIFPLCLASLILSFVFPPFATLISALLAFLIHISNELLLWCEQLPFRQLTFGQPPLWLTVLYSLVIIALLLAWEGKVWKRYRLHLLAALLLLAVVHYIAPYVNPYGKVTFVDVGQGDCIVVQLPYTKAVYVIDTGGIVQWQREEWRSRKNEYNVGKDVVLPYLRHNGIKKIDKLILTHGDQDHAGAALEILEGIAVSEVILGKKKRYDKQEQEIIQIALEKATVRIVAAGETWKKGGASFTVLSPFGDEEKDNNQSIVLYAELGGLTWLFTGDLEEEGEKKLMQEYPNLRADVLKVGHHGSRSSTSEEFIRVLAPQIAVISAGVRNRYGHPHREVLERLRAHKAKVWRTDEDGAILYHFRDKRGTFYKQLTYDESTK
ncbi:MAG: DNA internalization-related competence protein ComEC/Rec2 [Ectobacillus sp.]